MMRFHKIPPPRDCARCGKHFRPLALNGRYCTAGCSEAAAKERAKAYRAKIKKTTERTCVGCSKAFVPSHGSALACSDECKLERHRQTKATWYGTLSRAKPKMRTCLVCETPFEASSRRAHAVTCSPECSYLRYRDRIDRVKRQTIGQDPELDDIIKRKHATAYRARKRAGTVQHRTHCKACLGPLPKDRTARTTCSLSCAGKARAYKRREDA